jgi:hypothetical protein
MARRHPMPLFFHCCGLFGWLWYQRLLVRPHPPITPRPEEGRP